MHSGAEITKRISFVQGQSNSGMHVVVWESHAGMNGVPGGFSFIFLLLLLIVTYD